MMEINEIINLFKLKNTKIVNEDIMASCPFASKEHTKGTDKYRSFGINYNTLEWHCFSCRAEGKNIRSLATRLKIQIPPDIMYKTLLTIEEITARAKVKSKNYYDMSLLDSFMNNSEEAYNDLAPRGITKEAILKNKVCKDLETGSIIFPCLDDLGRLMGWVERNSIWDGRYGYRPNNVCREYLIFGLTSKLSVCFLTESTTDKIKLDSFGLDAVSTCGNVLFKEQAKRLLMLCDKIVVVPQNDKAAVNWLLDIKKHLLGKIPLDIITIPDTYKDVGQEDFTLQQFNSCERKILL